MIRIEKNIPLPRMPQKYPWATMRVGDSFFLPLNGECRSAVRSRGLSAGLKVYGAGCIASRTVGNGVRFWRIR
jgi:hypothetical protein